MIAVQYSLRPCRNEENGFYLLNRISRGSMGEVYRVRGEDGKLYACKVSRQKEMLRQESMLLEQVHHPLFPKWKAFWMEEETACLVMEYIAGSNLEELLRRRKRLQQEEAVRIAVELAGGLASVQEGAFPIVYRDIKPENMILQADGKIRLVDMGAAIQVTEGMGEQESCGEKESCAEREGCGERESRREREGCGERESRREREGCGERESRAEREGCVERESRREREGCGERESRAEREGCGERESRAEREVCREKECHRNRKNVRMGTIAYAPPEQWRRGEVPDVRSDIYALGKVLHYMVTGENPLKTVETNWKSEKICRKRQRRVMDKWLEQVIQDCLAYNPQERIPSMRELVRRLASGQKSFIGKECRKKRRNRYLSVKRTGFSYEKNVWKA